MLVKATLAPSRVEGRLTLTPLKKRANSASSCRKTLQNRLSILRRGLRRAPTNRGWRARKFFPSRAFRFSEGEPVANVTAAEPTRRDFLYIATGAVGAVGVAITAWPFIDEMNPTGSVLAAASIEADISTVQPGQQVI